MTWRDVPGYDGKYQISDDLQIRSMTVVVKQRDINGKEFTRIQPEKILKPFLNNKYYRVYLNKQLKYFHRIVALVFVPNPNNLPDVNHFDGNKLNNNPDNLEWADDFMNCQHAWKMGLNKLTPKMLAGLQIGHQRKRDLKKQRLLNAKG